MALIKYSNFLQTVAFVGVPVVVTQEGKEGFTLSAVYVKGENENLIEMAESVVMKDSELQKKYFKGLNTIERTLREAGIFEFSVKLKSDDISSTIRTVYTEKEKAERKKLKEDNISKKVVK